MFGWSGDLRRAIFTCLLLHLEFANERSTSKKITEVSLITIKKKKRPAQNRTNTKWNEEEKEEEEEKMLDTSIASEIKVVQINKQKGWIKRIYPKIGRHAYVHKAVHRKRVCALFFISQRESKRIAVNRNVFNERKRDPYAQMRLRLSFVILHFLRMLQKTKHSPLKRCYDFFFLWNIEYSSLCFVIDW